MTWWARLKWRAVHWAWREFQQASEISAGTPGARAFKRFGPESSLAFPPGSVFGESGIEIGASAVIGEQVSLTAGMLPGQDLLGLTVLRIGDRCVIGRGSHIVAHESITLGTSRVLCTSGRSLTHPSGNRESDG